jgi:hypothetical protein
MKALLLVENSPGNELLFLEMVRHHDKDAALGRPFQGWNFFADLTQGDGAHCPGLYYFAPLGAAKH